MTDAATAATAASRAPTPLDAALRVKGREVDALRAAIHVAADTVAAIDAARVAHGAYVARERGIAAAMSGSTLPFAMDNWTRRMRAERARMEEDARGAAARLSLLRSNATRVYGTLRAIEQAADNWRAAQERDRDAAEQAGIDDAAAIRFLVARTRQREKHA